MTRLGRYRAAPTSVPAPVRAGERRLCVQAAVAYLVGRWVAVIRRDMLECSHQGEGALRYFA